MANGHCLRPNPAQVTRSLGVFTGELDPGQAHVVVARHEPHCRILFGSPCDCDPTHELRPIRNRRELEAFIQESCGEGGGR